MNIKRKLEILQDISNDMENDVKEMEGLPFTGPNVAEGFGKQGAAIQALANILKSILTEIKEIGDNTDNIWQNYDGRYGK